MILEALPCSSGLSLNFSIPSSSAHRLQTPGCPPSTPRCPSCPPLPPRTGCGCREVKESVGSGRGVASGLDFLKPDRFTTVSWAQDRTAVSYKCPCQSLGREAPLLAEAPRPKAPTALGASPGKGSSSRRRPHSPQVSSTPDLWALSTPPETPHVTGSNRAHSQPLQVQSLWFQLPRELSNGRGHPESPPT